MKSFKSVWKRLNDFNELMVDEMLENKIINKSNSASPVVLFKKKDVTDRFCVDTVN